MMSLQTNESARTLNYKEQNSKSKTRPSVTTSQHATICPEEKKKTKPSKVKFALDSERNAPSWIGLKKPPMSHRESKLKQSKKKAVATSVLVYTHEDDITHRYSVQEPSHELILNQDKSRQSVRSVLAENLDSESDRIAWQKSNQMASGGTGEISMPQPKTQEQEPARSVQSHLSLPKQSAGFMLTFNQQANDKQPKPKQKKTAKGPGSQQEKAEVQSQSIGKRKSVQMPAKQMLLKPSARQMIVMSKPIDKLIAQSIRDDTSSIERETRRSYEIPSLMHSQNRGPPDKQNVYKQEQLQSRTSSVSPLRHKTSQTSLDLLIKQNIKNKEREKRDALREEETKLQRRKQMKQDYEAKLTQQRLESHRQASQEQFKQIKQQIEQTKKQSESIMATLEEQTPNKYGIRQTTKTAKDQSENVSENKSNERNLPQRLTSAERRRKDQDRLRFVSRSSSADRVLWEPDIGKQDNNKVTPIRRLPYDDKSASKRDQRIQDLGMEYLLLKKELALALPLNSNQSAILLQNKAAKPKFKPAPKEEEHNYSPVAKRLKVLVQDLQDSDKPKNKQQLVEQQKKLWQEKEREKAEKQRQEQQRILKNLMSLNQYQCRLYKAKPVEKLQKATKSRDAAKKKKHIKKEKPAKSQITQLLEQIKRPTGQQSKHESYQEESIHMREVKQMSGAFEGQPVFNVQISRGHKEPPNYFYSNFTVSKSISKSPRSASTRPVIAATGSASQFDNRKQTHPYAPLQKRSPSPLARKAREPVKEIKTETHSNADFVSPHPQPGIKQKPKSSQKKSQPRSQSRQKEANHLISIRSHDNQCKSASRESLSNQSPPSLSLPDAMSGISVASNSVSKAKRVSRSRQLDRSLTPSQGMVTNDSQNSKRRPSNELKQIGQKSPPKKTLQPQLLISQKSHLSSSKKQIKTQDSNTSGIPTADLDNEDLVIFLILTQAARMIQRTWRRYRFRKQYNQNNQKIRREILQEIEKKSIQRSPMKVSPYSQVAPTNMYSDKNTFNLPRNSREQACQRRPTFSFGQNDIRDPAHPIGSQEQDTLILEAGISMSDHFDTSVKNSRGQTATFQRPLEDQIYAELMSKNTEGNVPVDSLLKQASQLKKQQADNQLIIHKSEAVRKNEEVKRQPAKTVFAYNPLKGAPQVYESQFAHAQAKSITSQSSLKNETESRLLMSYGIDEADDPLSLQKDKRSKFISRIPQRSEEDSFSVAEKTDKIINYSAVLNTSEELIEAAVNQSSTLRNDHCASSVINSSLLHKIMPQPNGSFSGKSPAREEVMLDKIDKSKIIITNNFDPNDKEQILLLRAVSGGDESYANRQKHQIVHAYSTSKNTVQVQSQVSGGHQYISSVISGGILLPSLHSIDQSQSNTKSEANVPVHFYISTVQNAQDSDSIESRSPSPIKMRSNSGTDVYNFNPDKQSTSFQHALYQQNQYSFEGISQRSFLEQDGSHGYLVGPVNSANNSYFLHTNASIFDRNPFREYTTLKLQEMLMNKHDIQEIIQIKEDALNYAQNLEEGWIHRQEKLSELSPRSLKRRRFELEAWVSVERKGSSKSDKKSLSSSASIKISTPRAVVVGTIEEERAQVAKIIALVNKKSDEIKQKLKQAQQANSPKQTDTKEEEELQISIEDEEQSEAQMIVESKGEDNQQLADQIVDTILAELLQKELAIPTLTRVFKRVTPRPEVMLEVMPSVEQQLDLGKSLSMGEQIIAGVDTSADAVEQYIEGIFAQIRVRGKQFMSAFYTPIFKNPLVVLCHLQRQNIGQAFFEQMELANTLSSILNVQLYLTLEKARENIIREALQQIKDATKDEHLAQEENLSELLSESDHIHNKAIFDSVNEALNLFRPYGQAGEPMPWSSKHRKNFFMYASEEQLEIVLGSVKEKLMDWCTTGAGQISGLNVSHPAIEQDDGQKPEANQLTSEGSVIKQNQQYGLNEETLQLQRERCLAKLLAQDLIATEEKWTDYENEETQTKLDLADIVLEQLIQEIASELNSLADRDL